MRRYWIDPSLIHLFDDGSSQRQNTFSESSFVEIRGDSFHHILGVCRQGVGSQFEVLGLPNQALLVKITERSAKSAKASILKIRGIPPIPKPHLHLVLSIPRFSIFDSILERVVELGVHSLHPVFSDFSFVRTKNALPPQKQKRWEKIILSSTQQCGRGQPMILASPLSLSDLLKQHSFAPTDREGLESKGLFLYEGQAQINLRNHIQELKAFGLPNEIWLFVGSEGGFSSKEVQMFSDQGLPSLSLGDQVLRVETACIAALSVIKYELGILEQSHPKEGAYDGNRSI